MLTTSTINRLHTAILLGTQDTYQGDIKQDTLEVIEELIELREKIAEARDVLT